jgi:hypothetical protein
LTTPISVWKWFMKQTSFCITARIMKFSFVANSNYVLWIHTFIRDCGRRLVNCQNFSDNFKYFKLVVTCLRKYMSTLEPFTVAYVKFSMGFLSCKKIIFLLTLTNKVNFLLSCLCASFHYQIINKSETYVTLLYKNIPISSSFIPWKNFAWPLKTKTSCVFFAKGLIFSIRW